MGQVLGFLRESCEKCQGNAAFGIAADLVKTAGSSKKGSGARLQKTQAAIHQEK